MLLQRKTLAGSHMRESNTSAVLGRPSSIGLLLSLVLSTFPVQKARACPIQVAVNTTNDTVSGPVHVGVQTGNGVAQVKLWVDNDYLASSPPLTFTWDSTVYASGHHRITAVAYGSGGKRLCSGTTVVSVSNPPVTMVLPAPGSIVSGTVQVTTKVTGEVGRINLLVDGKYFSSPDYDFAFDTTQFPDGAHTISIEAMKNPAVNLGHASVVLTFANRSPVRCLTAGGYQGVEIFAAGEIYDLISHTFHQSAWMQWPRTGHSATRLLNGEILMAGGFVSSEDWVTNSTELFDPVIGAFTGAGRMANARVYDTATLLSNGMVLLAGGRDNSRDVLASAELFDPSTSTFIATGDMASPRIAHQALLLPDGTVLMTGGIVAGTISASAELYDPVSGAFTATGNMWSPRVGHTMTLMRNNKVLLTGGSGNTAELYDPGLGEFAQTATMGVARQWGHTATLLSNGKILIAGGIDNNYQTTAIAELYDPAAGTFLPTGSMNAGRAGHTATLLPDGTVLIVGGGGGAEIYLTDSATFVSVGDPVFLPSGGQTSTLVVSGSQ